MGDGSVWEPGQRGDNSDESRFALRSVMVGRKPPLRLTDSSSLAEQQKSAAAQVKYSPRAQSAGLSCPGPLSPH